jgi:SAM-dependent methyltransferase
VRPPVEAEIHPPEFPPDLEWLGVAFLQMRKLTGDSIALVEFFDTARINSHHTIPYLSEWHRRYRPHGLRVIGVHSPAYSFGRDPEVTARAIEKLAVPYPVVLDPDFEIWRDYGNRGWPGRYLFDQAGMLRDIHYGEGDYDGCERAIQEALLEIDAGLDLPAIMEPLRAEDAPGALMAAISPALEFPDQRTELTLTGSWTDGEDWIEATEAGATATFEFEAGEAWAVLSGTTEPGLYEATGTITADRPGLRLHGIQFTPIPPP